MKKRISISLVIVLCTRSRAACGDDTAANSTSETATESTVTENSTQDSAPVSNVISDVDISDYVYYSTAGEEFVAPKEKAIEGIPYELTEEEKTALIPESDIYVTTDEVKDYEYLIEGEKINYFAVASCSFTDEGKYDNGYAIYIFENEAIAARSYEVLSASNSDSVMYELNGKKIIQKSSISTGDEIDVFVSQCIDADYSYIVACDSGRLTGDIRARAVALFTREGTTIVADGNNDESGDQIAVSDTGAESETADNNTSDISLQEIAESYWFIGKTLSSQGGNWGASNITLSGADSNGFPTKITVSGSGYSLDGELLDGSFSIKIEECNDEFLIGQFSGSSHASIKGEFYDSAGNCLVVDIY